MTLPSSIIVSVVQKQSSSLEMLRCSTITEMFVWFIKKNSCKLGNTRLLNVFRKGHTFEARIRELNCQKTNLPVNSSACLYTEASSLFYNNNIHIFVRIHATAHNI